MRANLSTVAPSTNGHDGPPASIADGDDVRLASIADGDDGRLASIADGHHLRRAVVQLDHTLADLDAIARGLHPRDLAGGLGGALRALADRSPVPVRLAVVDSRFPTEIETAVYYVCAEALA